MQAPQTQVQTRQAGSGFQPTQSQQPQKGAARPAASQRYLTRARLNEIISEDVVTAERDTPLRTVVAMMAEHDVGSVIVVEENKPVGILTDRKVALALESMPDIAQQSAEELLDGDLTVADPSMSIFDALQLMNDEAIRRLPIVDDDGTLRGIVTLDDMLVLLGGAFGQVADTVESQLSRL